MALPTECALMRMMGGGSNVAHATFLLLLLRSQAYKFWLLGSFKFGRNCIANMRGGGSIEPHAHAADSDIKQEAETDGVWLPYGADLLCLPVLKFADLIFFYFELEVVSI